MKILKLGLLVLSLAGASSAFASGNRAQTVYQADKFANKALEWAQYLRYQCGCNNTAATLEQMAEASQSLGIVARFSSKPEAVDAFKELAILLPQFKVYSSHIHDATIRLKVKKAVLLGLNSIGKALMGPELIVFRSAIVGGTTTAAAPAIAETSVENLTEADVDGYEVESPTDSSDFEDAPEASDDF